MLEISFAPHCLSMMTVENQKFWNEALIKKLFERANRKGFIEDMLPENTNRLLVLEVIGPPYKIIFCPQSKVNSNFEFLVKDPIDLQITVKKGIDERIQQLTKNPHTIILDKLHDHYLNEGKIFISVAPPKILRIFPAAGRFSLFAQDVLKRQYVRHKVDYYFNTCTREERSEEKSAEDESRYDGVPWAFPCNIV